jgi:hypothetical protein
MGSECGQGLSGRERCDHKDRPWLTIAGRSTPSCFFEYFVDDRRWDGVAPEEPCRLHARVGHVESFAARRHRTNQ